MRGKAKQIPTALPNVTTSLLASRCKNPRRRVIFYRLGVLYFWKSGRDFRFVLLTEKGILEYLGAGIETADGGGCWAGIAAS
jgi:hypothetical protein